MPGLDVDIRNFRKEYGEVTAVSNMSFGAAAGRITGFLGPNGAGKSTTLKALVGLVSPTSGNLLIGGKRYDEIQNPARTVGAHFENAFHPGRSARNHLRVYAPLVGVDNKRCDEVLELVGLGNVANRRTGGFSMGMRQRLGLATALLGDPDVLVLDESANGLDPAGVRWLRDFLRAYAASGKTVLLSSHILSEVQQTVDDVVIIAEGELRFSGTLSDLRADSIPISFAQAASAEALNVLAQKSGVVPQPGELPNSGFFYGLTPSQLGNFAWSASVELHELRAAGESLEEIFLKLTAPSQPPAAGTPITAAEVSA